MTSATTSANLPATTSARPLRLAGYTGLLLLLISFVLWAFIGVNLNLVDLVGDSGRGVQTARQFFPPDWSVLPQEWSATLLTIQMALVGTILGAVAAVPVSFFAARTTSLVPGLSSFIKTLLNISRATPVVVYAIILEAMVGLGQRAGALSIAVGTFVMLTKLYAEALESVAAGPVEAVRAAGGNAIQTFVFGMLPQVFPNYVATTLYAFELNMQASFILGFVGAGGIGYDLLNFSRMFDWPKVCTIIILTVIVVNVVDFISYRIRKAIS